MPDAGLARAWFGGREAFMTFQWHYDIFALPPGATRVLTNGFNPDQAYVFGKNLGLQCHVEMTRPMVEAWVRTGASDLPERTHGARQSSADMLLDLDLRLAELSRVADEVYAHWAQGLAA